MFRPRSATRGTSLLALLLVVLAAIATSSAIAQTGAERVVVPVPEGWRILFRNATQAHRLTEMIPAEERGSDWSRMLTTITYPGVVGQDPARVSDQFLTAFSQNCDRKRRVIGRRFEEEGSPTNIAVIECFTTPEAQQQPGEDVRALEFMVIKVIQGPSAMHIAQMAWHTDTPPGTAPLDDPDRLAGLYTYIAGARVCLSGVCTPEPVEPVTGDEFLALLGM